MRKITSLLTLILCFFAGTAQAQISSASEIDANKCYTITTKTRGSLVVTTGATRMAGNNESGFATTFDATDPQFQFAFVTYQGNTYLYSVGASKYVSNTQTGTLVDVPSTTDAVTVESTTVSVSGYPLGLRFYNGTSSPATCVNLGGGKQLTIDTWGATWGTFGEDGNAWAIVEATSFDPTAALAVFATTVNVTYNLYESDGTTLVSTVQVVQEKNSAVSIPSSMQSSYYDFATSGTIGETDCTINVTRTLKAGIVLTSGLSNNKSYYITTKDNDRGSLSTYTTNGTTYLASPVKSSLGISEKKFAILSYEDKYYLYSVEDGKFVTYQADTQAPLADVVTGTSDAVSFSTTTTPLYEIMFDGSTSKIINSSANYTYGVVMNSWGSSSSQWDEGCQYTINEAEDFDPTAALAALEAFFHPTYFVSYVVKDTDNNTLFTSDPVATTYGAVITTLPAEYQRAAFYTYNTVNVTISTTGTTVVEFVATPRADAPVKYTTDATAPVYYNMSIRNKYLVYDANATGEVKLEATSEPFNADASWAFVGTPYNGFHMINKTKGTGYYLTYTSVVVARHSDNNIQFVAAAGATDKLWILDTNSGGFVLRMKENTDIYFHHDNGNNYLRTCSVTEWSGVHNDAGSTIVASTDEQVLFDLYNEMEYYTFGTAIGQYNTTDETVVTNAQATQTLQLVGEVIANQQTADYAESYNALLTIKNNIALIHPTAGYYRLKNVATGKYLVATALAGYNTQTDVVFANGTATDPATVIELREQSDGLYMYTQGAGFGWVDASASVGSGKVWVTTNPDKYVNWFPGTAAGQIAFAICIGNGTGSYASYLKKGIFTTNDNEAVVGGTDPNAAAAQWIFEAAEEIILPMTECNGKYYATTYLPFAVRFDATTAIPYTVFVNSTKAVYNSIDSYEVPAETGVLLISDSPTNGAKAEIIASAEAVTGNELVGHFFAANVADALVLNIVNGNIGFYSLSATGTLAANRAYINKGTNNIQAMQLVAGNATGIQDVTTKTGENKVFDLQGRRVQNAQKGLYIVNGKKVIL